MKKQTLLFLSLLTIATLSAAGQANQTAVPTLRIEPGPISTGRGFTGVAQANQASTAFWNPAGLGFQKGLQFGLSRFKWLPGLDNDLTYNHVTGRYTINGVGTIGGHVSYLDLGAQSIRNNQGNSLGDFSSYELFAGLSIGRVIIPKRLSLGIGFRFVSSRLAPYRTQIGSYKTENAYTLGADFGTLYKPGAYTLAGIRSVPSIGMSITNFGGRLSYSTSGIKNTLPTLFRLGISNKILLGPEATSTLRVNVDVSKLLVDSDSTGAKPPFKSLFSSWRSYKYFNGERNETVTLAQQLMIGTGLEYWYNNLLALRTGYYYENPNNGGREFITFGGSLKYHPFQINVSIALPQKKTAVNNIVRVGLMLNW